MHKCRDELRQKRIASLFLNAVRSVVSDGAQLNHTAHPSDESGLGEKTTGTVYKGRTEQANSDFMQIVEWK